MSPHGYKQRRYADAVEIVDGEVTNIHQVGKVNKNGTPIMRELVLNYDLWDF